MSNLDNILAAAKASAENLPATTTLPSPAGLPAVPASGGNAVAYNMDADAMLAGGGMEVESYIQVKDTGIKLSKDWQGVIDSFEATLDLSEVQLFMGIRKEVGSNVSYAKTYDGVTTTRGEIFAQVVAEFKASSQKPADPYRGADIPLTLTTELADPRDKKRSLAAGTRVGLTTSITGFKPFANFFKKCRDAGLGTSVVKISVKHSPRRNAAGQDYGVCEFDVLEIVEDNRPSAAA